ncbi:hypothetical protein BC628DRAFT_1420093 [Trametes gibbosa]|nr:hypothetical protein BC628DRAFT_1420093 [Trametes gibbosa]
MARTKFIREQQQSQGGSPSPPEFPSPFIFHKREPITLVELRMRRFSGAIRSKLNWWVKVHDADIVMKWRAEMVEQDRATVDTFWGGDERFEYGDGEKQWPREPINDAQLDYIFAQLRYEADHRDPATGIFATAIPKVHESRSLIPSGLKSSLVSCVSILERVPDDEKDWHPGSNKQVLDLVHPSLYCLRIDHSLVRTSGSAEATAVHVLTEEEYRARRPDFAKDGIDYIVSPLYQWLPTDFVVSDVGDVKALNYINNIHPITHRPLYTAISSVLSRFVPLFERVLSDALSPEPPQPIVANPHEWYSHVEEPDFSNADSEGNEEEDAYEKWEREMQWPLIPDPSPFSPPPSDGRVEIKLHGRTIQVIVKLANIVLTPENPKYLGGSWHVEGMANEKIVATGLYYYACENITESRLNFRTVVGDSTDHGVWMPYQQSDSKGYYTAYGFSGGDALNQELGHVLAEEDKCIAFPNIYQHRVDGFELADPTKPGVRKILCFFLVDPLTRILSTSDVPPQQENWSMDEMQRVPAMLDLPVELFDMVAEYAKVGTISRKEAEEHREKLMAERANFVLQHNEEVYEIEFSMCEH